MEFAVEYKKWVVTSEDMDLRGKQGQTRNGLYFNPEPKGENWKDF